MKNFVSKLEYKSLVNTLLNKRVNFISDCEFFPNFNVTGYVFDITIHNNEYLFHVRHKNGKKYTIGSHMKNLSYSIL